MRQIDPLLPAVIDSFLVALLESGGDSDRLLAISITMQYGEFPSLEERAEGEFLAAPTALALAEKFLDGYRRDLAEAWGARHGYRVVTETRGMRMYRDIVGRP